MHLIDKLIDFRDRRPAAHARIGVPGRRDPGGYHPLGLPSFARHPAEALRTVARLSESIRASARRKEPAAVAG
jgi:hypothetical protein